jgi:hypothetical protein
MAENNNGSIIYDFILANNMESSNEPVNVPVNEPVNVPVNEPVNEPVNVPLNESLDESSTESQNNSTKQIPIETFYDPVGTYFTLRFGTFKEICDLLKINLDNKYFGKYLNPNHVIKYKLDCLSDYNILMKQNKQIICVGQANIFNISELISCQIIYMRIQYKSFKELFEELEETPTNYQEFNFNITNINELTTTYINQLKKKSSIIINYILSQLNYENKYDNLLPLLNKIKNEFPFDEVVYTDEPKPELKIGGQLEKSYWVNSIKKFLEMCEKARGKYNKMLVSRQIYNCNHKYIHHIINHNKFRITSINKVNELIIDVRNLAYEYLNNLNNSNENPEYNSELYYNISQCVSTLNSYNRYKMLVEMDDINIEPPLIYTIKRHSDNKLKSDSMCCDA